MPQRKLQSRPDVDAIPFSKGKTTFYSDPDADVKGIRLKVSAKTKNWVWTRRVNGSIKQDVVGKFPDLPTIYVAAKKRDDDDAPAARKASAATTGLRTLNDALEQRIKGRGLTTQGDYYRAQVRRHLSELFAMPVEEIAIDDIERALSDHTTRIGGKLYATRTYSSLRQIISFAFKRAVAQRKIPDVLGGVEPLPAAPKDNEVHIDLESDWIVLDLIDELKTSARSELAAYGWELMLFTGLRSINAKSLRWDDVDLEKATLRLRRLKNGRDITFPMSKHVTDLLAHLQDRTGHQQWVFPHRNRAKEGQHVASFGKQLKRGEQYLRPHDMRRLFTTAAEASRIGQTQVDEFRGDMTNDKGKQRMASTYNQGTITHGDAEAITRQIFVLCGRNPDAEVVPLRAGKS